MKTQRWIRYTLLAVLLLTVLTACAPEDTQLMVSLFDEWAREKGFNPKDEKGEWDIGGVIGAVTTGVKMAVNGSTGDAETDAAIGILSVVYPIKDNDEATDKGLDTRDPDKIKGAIKARPDDYHYRNALGAVLLANGDTSGADAAFREGDEAWKRSNPKGSETYRDRVNSRDIMGSLDRSINAARRNGTTQAGVEAMRRRYCEEALRYWSATSDRLYLNRADSRLGIDCLQYLDSTPK